MLKVCKMSLLYFPSQCTCASSTLIILFYEWKATILIEKKRDFNFLIWKIIYSGNRDQWQIHKRVYAIDITLAVYLPLTYPWLGVHILKIAGTLTSKRTFIFVLKIDEKHFNISTATKLREFQENKNWLKTFIKLIHKC